MESTNVYTPVRARIKEIVRKTPDVNLYKVDLSEEVTYEPGQFFEVSVWGAGEAPISIASHLKYADSLELCIRKTGLVTSAIHRLSGGDELWLRGPYGNGFPLDEAQGRDIVIVAGGIGMAPLRPLLYEFSGKEIYSGRKQLIYGSRMPEDVVFRDEIEYFRQLGFDVVATVDRSNGNWEGRTGFVTDFLLDLKVETRNSIAYICGPEIMIRNVTRDLNLMGVPADRIITTLEAHMKCGVGKCGHCYAGCKYICTDGPVFNYKQLKEYQIL